MPSLRDMLPYLIGGAAGALSPRGADAVQSAAAWSNRLRQQDVQNERNVQYDERSARRLQLAEEQAKRGEETHKMRTTAEQRRIAKEDKELAEESQSKANLELMKNSYAEKATQRGLDPSLLEAGDTFTRLSAIASRMGLDKMTLEEGRAYLADRDVSPGESLSIYTVNGQLTKRGATEAAAGTTVTPRQLANVVHGVTNKQKKVMFELEEDLAAAQADFHSWHEENQRGGGQIGPEGQAIDKTGRSLQRSVNSARAAIELEQDETIRKIEEQLIKAKVPGSEIDRIMSKLQEGPEQSPDAASAAAASDVDWQKWDDEIEGGELPEPVLAALAAQQPQTAQTPGFPAYTPTPSPESGLTPRRIVNNEPGGLLPPPQR